MWEKKPALPQELSPFWGYHNQRDVVASKAISGWVECETLYYSRSVKDLIILSSSEKSKFLLCDCRKGLEGESVKC